MIRLATFPALVVGSGACAFATGLVEVHRGDSDAGTTSFDAAVTLDSSLWDGISANPRWIGTRLLMDGVTYIVGRAGQLELSKALDPTNPSTLKISFVGRKFAIPRQTTDPTPYDPCPPPPSPVAARISPRLWGNKPVLFYASFGPGPLKMAEKKIFEGWSYQKKDTNDTTVKAEVTCVDDSVLYATTAICYELQPFAGKRRGEIVREIAAIAGIDPATVIVPIGDVVAKPILLSNGSLLPFIAEFGAPENWYPFFDENGVLNVIDVEMKDTPDWTLDLAKGDYDFDQIEEEPPTQPPSRYYSTAQQPIANSGPDSQELRITNVEVDTESDLYNPQCVKVRPSGGASFLNADGTYRALPEQELMLVYRLTTKTTTQNGVVILKEVKQEGFYNPAAYDPNFDTWPLGSSYNGAYGDKSFHAQEVETFMITAEETSTFLTDDNGTVRKSIVESKGWYAPHRALAFAGDPPDPMKLRNDPNGSFVFAGNTARNQKQETYGVVQRVETEFVYGGDGALASTIENTFSYLSPESRCDIVVTTTVPDNGPAPAPTPSVPPPAYPPPPAPPPPQPPSVQPHPRPAPVPPPTSPNSPTPTVPNPTVVISQQLFLQGLDMMFAVDIGGPVDSWAWSGELQSSYLTIQSPSNPVPVNVSPFGSAFPAPGSSGVALSGGSADTRFYIHFRPAVDFHKIVVRSATISVHLTGTYGPNADSFDIWSAPFPFFPSSVQQPPPLGTS